MQKEIRTRIVLGFCLAVLGWCSMCLPLLFSGSTIEVYGSQPYFPIMGESVEGLGKLNLILLFLSGFVPGLVFPLRSFVSCFIGLVSLSPFMFMTLLEVVMNRGPHNLFPFEIVEAF
jgi:hypothetical protein